MNLIKSAKRFEQDIRLKKNKESLQPNYILQNLTNEFERLKKFIAKPLANINNPI